MADWGSSGRVFKPCQLLTCGMWESQLLTDNQIDCSPRCRIGAGGSGMINSRHAGQPISTVIVYSSIMIVNRPESLRSSRSTRGPKVLVAQVLTGMFGRLTRTLNRESVGRGFEPRPPHVITAGRWLARALVATARLFYIRAVYATVRAADRLANLRAPLLGPGESPREKCGRTPTAPLSPEPKFQLQRCARAKARPAPAHLR